MTQKNVKLLTEIHKKLTHKGWEKLQAERGDKVISMLGRKTLVNEITDNDVEKVINTLQSRGLLGSTINRYLSSLSKMLRYANKRHSIYQLDKMPYIDWNKEDNGRERYLELEEEKQIIKLLTEWGMLDYSVFFIFLIDTGLRLGEALAVKKSMVSNINNSFVINLPSSITKNNEPRGVPLTQRTKAIVSKLINNIDRNELIFKHIKYWTAENTWRRLRKAMKLEDDKEFVIHCLRHTCATRLAQSGKVELHMIGQMLGHKSWKMIKRYSHLIPNNLMGAVNVLNQINNQGDK